MGPNTGCAATHWPPTKEANRSTTPMVVASMTLPGRKTRMYQPIRSAIGIVMAMVKVPQGLEASALTTTRARTASRIVMIMSTAMSAVKPATGPISSLAIWPRVLPSRRIEPTRITMSCTAPATTTPTRIQSMPGR
ncbi:hypothetical protein D3C72_718320 [compost metagenome]